MRRGGHGAELGDRSKSALHTSSSRIRRRPLRLPYGSIDPTQVQLTFQNSVFRLLCEPQGLGLDHSFLSRATHTSTFSAAMNASCGMSTLPYWRIFFLPSF